MAVPLSCCAAQYIRMSSDTQDLSPEIQEAVIAAYAARNGLVIVKTFLDEARSGVTLQKRPAMKRLLMEAMNPGGSFSIVLVYDVSRWGRFQDPDASAYYEYACRKNGVDVRYVEEPFSGMDTLLASLFKGMKRVMAAEFSRELSAKTTAGQTKAMSKGFQLGTLPCLGISRIAVSKADGSERRLGPKEHKAGRGEHIKWMRASEEEVKLVRWIFETYAKTEISVVNLARQLERDGVRTRKGYLVSEWMLYSFLRSETVIGNFVWGRAQNKKMRAEGDQRFRRALGFIEPMVSRRIFDAVQVKLARRKHVVLTKDILIDQLRAALVSNPHLRAHQLKTHGCPCRESYIKHFGSLRASWEAAGATYPVGQEGLNYVDVERSADVGAEMCDRIHAFLGEAGVACKRLTRKDRRGQTLLINDTVILRLQMIWKRPRYDGEQWEIRKIYKGPFDWILLVRMNDNLTPLDSILFRRDQYFAHEKWLQDELTGRWQVCTNTEQLGKMFNGLRRPSSATSPVLGQLR